MIRLLLVLGALVLGGCAYRAQGPIDLGEQVAVTIDSNQGRLVRSQAYVQQAIASELGRDLGWEVSPAGTARLAATITGETIDVVASGQLGIPERWRVRLSIAWSLETSTSETLTGKTSASAFYDDRSQETRALRDAALSAARNMSAELRSIWSQHAAEPGGDD